MKTYSVKWRLSGAVLLIHTVCEGVKERDMMGVHGRLLTVGVFHSQRKQAFITTRWLLHIAEPARTEKKEAEYSVVHQNSSTAYINLIQSFEKNPLTWNFSFELDLIKGWMWCYAVNCEWIIGNTMYYCCCCCCTVLFSWVHTVYSCLWWFIKNYSPEENPLAFCKASTLLCLHAVSLSVSPQRYCHYGTAWEDPEKIVLTENGFHTSRMWNKTHFDQDLLQSKLKHKCMHRAVDLFLLNISSIKSISASCPLEDLR